LIRIGKAEVIPDSYKANYPEIQTITTLLEERNSLEGEV
jgi:hypothetical protein